MHRRTLTDGRQLPRVRVRDGNGDSEGGCKKSSKSNFAAEAAAAAPEKIALAEDFRRGEAPLCYGTLSFNVHIIISHDHGEIF